MAGIKAEKWIEKIESKFSLTEKKWYRVKLKGDAYFSHVITEAIKTLSEENRRLTFGNYAGLIWHLNMDLEQKKAFELAARDYIIEIEPLDNKPEEKLKARPLVYK